MKFRGLMLGATGSLAPCMGPRAGPVAEELVMMKIAPIRLATAAAGLSGGTGRSAPRWIPSSAGSLPPAVFSLFWRFRFPIPDGAGNSPRKSFGRLGNSALADSRHALKTLRNLKNCRVIREFHRKMPHGALSFLLWLACRREYGRARLNELQAPPAYA